MPRTYVDNAYNRSAGRVGMAHGTAVISSSGGGGSRSYSSSSASSSKTYVDNAYNRSAGRVGMTHGTAVISSSGGGGSGYYSSSSGNSSKTYVDNAYNRSAGRVGMAHGSAVISSSGGGSSRSSSGSSSKTYVDNAYNRSAGRVGMEHGTAVISSSGGGNIGGKSGGGGGGRSTSASTTRRYVDNPSNRRLGRVGLVVGTAVVSSRNNISCRGADVDLVFQPLVRIDPEDDNLEVILQQITRLRNDLQRTDGTPDHVRENQFEAAIGILHRHEAAVTRYSSGLRTPEWVRGGEVIHISDIALGEKIGGGGFGDVFVGVWKGNQQVAIKKLRVQRVSQAKKEQFQKEVEVFSSLSHPAIVKFFGVCATSPNLAIIMEFMSAGSLYDILHVEVRPLTQTTKFQMVTDCLSAIAYLHDRNITHRDVKSMNIMVTEDYGNCKLGDFGLALKEETRATASVADHGVVGTLSYSPPEVVEGRRLTMNQFKAVDVYSMTVVIKELLSGKVPYKGMNQHQVMRLILAGTPPSSFVQGGELGAILSKGMAKSPMDRPTAISFLGLWETLAVRYSMGQLNIDVPTTAGSGSSSFESLITGIVTSESALSTPTSVLSATGTNSASRSLRSGSSMSSSRIKCKVCLMNQVEQSFVCGHLVCGACLPQLSSCPQCRGPINNPIRIFI